MSEEKQIPFNSENLNGNGIAITGPWYFGPDTTDTLLPTASTPPPPAHNSGDLRVVNLECDVDSRVRSTLRVVPYDFLTNGNPGFDPRGPNFYSSLGSK